MQGDNRLVQFWFRVAKDFANFWESSTALGACLVKALLLLHRLVLSEGVGLSRSTSPPYVLLLQTRNVRPIFDHRSQHRGVLTSMD